MFLEGLIEMKLEEHLDNLTRHIDIVRESCLLLGNRLISRGEQEFGRLLIARGYQHDISKFYGIEFAYLHNGQDVPEDALELAIKHHQCTNDHHPEYWGGINEMPRISAYEMLVDWFARSNEFGTGLRDWITESAVDRFKLELNGRVHKHINDAVDLLLDNPFKSK